LPPLDVPAVDPAKKTLGDAYRRGGVWTGFRRVSEIEVIRHFTRLFDLEFSRLNLGMYPLGFVHDENTTRGLNEFCGRDLDGICDGASVPAAGIFRRDA